MTARAAVVPQRPLAAPRAVFGAALIGALFAALFVAMPAAADDAKAPDFATVLRAVVGLRSHVPYEARTAKSLGTEREGSGVVIDNDGLVLTIGYLILEASAVAVIDHNNVTVPARVVAYDHNTGFGLIRANRPLGVTPLAFGDSSGLEEGDPVLAVSNQGPHPVMPARVVSRRTFAGYWEYLLDNAIFTAPPHPLYGGAALIGPDGTLLGIGSLLVGDATPLPDARPGNMFVPINGLKPILSALLDAGRSADPPHPWLGIYTEETKGRVFVARLATDGPGEKAGLKPGDIIVGVGGRHVRSMADFLRKVWAVGAAGATVPLDVVHLNSEDMTIVRIEVRSRDRYDWLKLKSAM